MKKQIASLSFFLVIQDKNPKKAIALFFCGLILLNTQVLAQVEQKACNCSVLLQESVQKVSTIYAGFEDKVTPQTRPQYNQLVNRLQKQALNTKDERMCYEIIKQYTDWFKDGHVGVWFGIQSSPSALRKISMKEVSRILSIAKDSLEGAWSTADKKHRYAIIEDPLGINKFIAVTLKSTDSAWQPGMVKAEFYGYDLRHRFYRGMYYQTNFSGVLNGFTLHHNRLDHWFGPSMYRDNDLNVQQEVQTSNLENVQFKVLNKDFIYLKLGKFNQEDVDKLDSLIRANQVVIHKTKNLILDLRGNPGGSSNASQEMIQLIYTNPIIYPAWQYRSSPELIEAKKKEIAELSKNDPYNRLKGQQLLLNRLLDRPGQLVSGGDSIVRTVDSISTYPERVAFLIDKGSGSSAEFFTFEGKQSKKVTLFGANTAGVMDYGEAQDLNLSCGQYLITVPWGRNGWIERFGFRIDNIGFAPDVPILSGEPDWVQFVVIYWSK